MHLYKSFCPTVGLSVGWSVRCLVGPSVGPLVNPLVGPLVGPSVGPSVGQSVGPWVGLLVGTSVTLLFSWLRTSEWPEMSTKLSAIHISGQNQSNSIHQNVLVRQSV